MLSVWLRSSRVLLSSRDRVLLHFIEFESLNGSFPGTSAQIMMLADLLHPMCNPAPTPFTYRV